ncbi:MAG: hypothetical protein HC935_04650 [Pseudanabaena sp. SU_2_4]|nr:hypothetical protein [Pseudanabaena sp. SU_2_4]
MTARNMSFSNYTFDPSKYTPFAIASKPMTDDWRRWIAENKLLGAPDESIIATLVQHGIDRHTADRELQIVISHPYFQAGRNLTQALKKIESHLDIYAKLNQLSSKSQQ